MQVSGVRGEFGACGVRTGSSRVWTSVNRVKGLGRRLQGFRIVQLAHEESMPYAKMHNSSGARCLKL